MLQKWEELEDANGGAALNFTNVSSVHTGDPVGPDWSIVFAPLWFSEACVVLVSSLAMYMALGVSRNTRLLHMNSNAQAIGAAIFKVTLMQRLQSESGSWLNAFSPMYASMMVQSLLHYHKEADARGKRSAASWSWISVLTDQSLGWRRYAVSKMHSLPILSLELIKLIASQ